MIKTNNTTSWQEEAGDSILAGLRNKGREKALVIPEVAVAEPVKPIKEQGEKLFGVKRGVSKVLTNNADVPFVDRINNYQDYPMPEKNEDGSISTHLLSAELDEEGIAWVFPNKVLNKKDNTYTTYQDNYEALAAAKADGNAVRFRTIQEANLFSQSYKNEDFEKYYSPSEEERGKTFEGSGRNIIDTAKQAYKGVLNVIEESPIPLFGKDSLGTDTLGKVADAVPPLKKLLSSEDSVKKRKEEIEKLSVDIEERTPDNLSLTQQGFRAALESAPLTAVAMVTSIFGTPAAGLAVMGAYTGSLEFNEAREKGKAYGASLAYGTVQGGIEAFTERLGLGPLMKMFKDKGNGFMTNAIAYGTRELIGENAAEFGQSMTAWYAGLDEALMNPDLSKTEKLLLQAQRQYVASVAALSMSGTTTTASATVNNLASQVQTNNEPSIAEGWVKSDGSYTRSNKDGNPQKYVIFNGATVYTKTFYANGEPVLPEKITRQKKIKDDSNNKAPANEYGMYSKLEEALFNMKLEKNNPQDVMNYFKNNAVVWDEMRDSGMLTFLQDSIKKGKPITRKELMNQFYEGSLTNTMDKVTLSTDKNRGADVLTPEHLISDSVIYGRPLPENANGRALTEEEIKEKSIANGKEIYEEAIHETISDQLGIIDSYSQDVTKLPYSFPTLPYLSQAQSQPMSYYLTQTGSKYSQEEITTAIYEATLKANTKQIDYIQSQAEDIGTSNIGASKIPMRGYTPQERIDMVEAELDKSYVEALQQASVSFSEAYIKNTPEYIWTLSVDTRDGEREKYTVTGNNDLGYDIGVQDVDESGNASSMRSFSTHERTLNEVQAFIKSRNPISKTTETKFGLADMVAGGYSESMPWDTYKETLIVMDSPQRKDAFGDTKLIGGYPNSHWSVDNIVLHLRTTEREDIDGNKILFIEELQSDWLEAGEKRGWKNSDDLIKANTMLLDNAVKNQETAKEIISEFRANLKEQFPEDALPVKDGVNFRQFLKPFEQLDYTQEVNLLKDIYKSEDTEIDDLVNKFSEAYGNIDNGIDPLKNFSLFFEVVKRDAYAAIYDSKIDPSVKKILSDARDWTSNRGITNMSDIIGSKRVSSMKEGDEFDIKYDNEYWKKLVPIDNYENMNKEIDIIEKKRMAVSKLESAVPKMPSKDKWHELGMRVAMQMAVEGGYTRIAWTNSDEQVTRWKKGPTEIQKYNKALGKEVTVKIPEGANKRMFISLYDKKMPSYAKRLANQYNSTVGKSIIDFENKWTAKEWQRIEEKLKEEKGSSYLDISPEMIEAVKKGRVKFYSKGGLVSRPNTYRRKFAEGGNVEAPIPFTDLKDYVLGQIEETEFGFGKGWIQKEMIKQVNEGFLKLGDNPKQEKIIKFYNNAIPKFEKYLGNETAGRITDAYEVAFDNYFSYEIPGSESETATKVAGASAIAGGGSTAFSKAGEWFDKGKNARVPGEDTAKWKTLLKDDWAQRQKQSLGGKKFWNPLRGFFVQDATKGGLKSGPTPAVRQAIKRTGSLLSKAATAVPPWLSGPLQLLNPSPLADSTIEGMYGVNPGTPEYEEWEKKSIAKFENYNNSLLESRQVKSNMANKSDKRDKREGVRQANEIAMQNRERAAQQAATKASNAAKKQAEEHAKAQQQKAQKQKAQEQVYKQTKVDNKGNTGYTGQGNQSRAGNRKSAPAPKPVRRGKNYGVTGKRVTGGR